MKHSCSKICISLFFATGMSANGFAQPQAAAPTSSALQNRARPSAQTTVPVRQQNSASPVATPKVTAAPAAAPAPAPVSDSPVESILSEDLIRALRDPFQLPAILMVRKENPKTDMETYELKDFHLNGVITGPKKTRAMLTAPGNKVYFAKLGDKIGVRDGKITQILSDAIKVTEYATDEHGKRIPDSYELMMTGELVSLNRKKE